MIKYKKLNKKYIQIFDVYGLLIISFNKISIGIKVYKLSWVWLGWLGWLGWFVIIYT